MPNLEKDPRNPTDLLGQPIADGDIVAWGTNFNQSAAICVAVIEKIQFTRPKVPGSSYSGNEKCERHQAEDYYLRLRPLHGTNSVTWIYAPTGQDEWRVRRDPVVPDRRDAPEQYIAKTVTVKLVKNVIKLDLTETGVNKLVRKLTA